MTHPGWIGGFPGDWAYQGKAKLLVKDILQEITVSLQLSFGEVSEINTTLIWEGVDDETRLHFAVKMEHERQQTLIVQDSIVLIGYSIPPFDTNHGTTIFNVLRLITYSAILQDKSSEDTSEDFIQLRSYLNDEFSSHDDLFDREFENVPIRKGANFRSIINGQGLYCVMNSGYEVKCGKKYVVHKEHTILHRKNIETLYKLSFIDLKLSLNNNQIQEAISQIDERPEVNSSQHLEKVTNDLCSFLSIICEREILPIYYDYSVSSRGKYIYGRIVPFWEKRRVPRVSKAWPDRRIHFLGNITSFLECCPLNEQISRGIGHLKLTVLESTVELKLMASCAAIEYFYSYWFRELDGLSKLIIAGTYENRLLSLDQGIVNRLKKLVGSKAVKTPFLSKVIRFFLEDIGIDWKKYMADQGSPHFIEIRNGILHGSFITDDVEVFRAEEMAQKLGSEILFSIMKRISKSGDNQLYESLPIRLPEEEFHFLSDGWPEIGNILDELHSKMGNSVFWHGK